MADHTDNISYSQFACIGSGFSAIGLGAQLKRWYGITDIRFFERDSELGGTWFSNQYPGCACDVPTTLYSFSFEQNPKWTHVLPSRQELWDYLKAVADKYDLPQKMTFNTTVERCEWIEKTARWRLHINRKEDQQTQIHECQFLFSATGYFGKPRGLDNIPGVDTFQGPVLHSSRWDPAVDLTDKRVVVFGNGCTGTQMVPAILRAKAKHVTHVVRSRHWIMPADFSKPISPLMRTILTYLPGMGALRRLLIFCFAENDFRAFAMDEAGARYRQRLRARSETYMRSTAPAKYHDMLIPEFEVGCKRRIFDSSGYLASLHAPNLTLTDEEVVEVLPQGLRMRSDTIVDADVIALASGFKTEEFFGDIDVVGRGGETLQQHWDRFGGPEAYNCCAMNGFPNFFMLLGPNTAQGHTSVLMAVENAINYALRILKPVLARSSSQIAEVKRSAEEAYVDRIQAELQKTVYFSGCHSWYLMDNRVKGKSKWNGLSYPYSQVRFWYHCLFPVWKDWEFRGEKMKQRSIVKRKNGLLVATGAIVGAGVCLLLLDNNKMGFGVGFQTKIAGFLKGLIHSS
ncbi:hypothetical protein B0H66DRAFT_552468 [Apodospora peruviana]|uniref:Monooxygenase n=1 Tax=Apodospora peruviana TaxID=516989 RepID=A0AAE0IB29_9PEZI|nr:hypothetical protein B0H66DRAFT_552468 [Apodospora peruviana]